MSRANSVKVAQLLRAQQRAESRLVLVTQAIAEYNAAIDTVNALDPTVNHPYMDLTEVWKTPKD